MSLNPLLDKTFIELLDKHNERELYAKIICLTMDELPVEEISGKVSQGSLSIDGTSAVRRTCSLTITSDAIDINEYYWSFNTKFKLYLGLKVPDYIKNITEDVVNFDTKTMATTGTITQKTIKPYENYPDIIWFPQGIFLITDFKYTLNATSTDSIYITGKDIMALINGDIGGHFPHSTDVSIVETSVYDENGKEIDKEETELTIYEIIREMIHKYANEPFHNIIIKDITNGLELLDYQGTNDIFLFKNIENGLFENVIFDGDVVRYDVYNNPIKISEIPDDQLDSLTGDYIKKGSIQLKNTKNSFDDTYYTVVKCTYGSIIGYRTTTLTWPNANKEPLIANVGETVSSVLDKIVNKFGDYEYFYDLEGKFVFQRKLTYINTSWNSLNTTWSEANTSTTNYNKSNLINDFSVNTHITENQLQEETYSESTKLTSQVQYSFVGNTLTTTLNNTPNIANIRNDFAIWGKRKSSSDSKENSFHLRCAIDEKPTEYVSYLGKKYTSTQYDWRELIYQMGVDFLEYNHNDDFEVKISKNNPSYKFGKTGYEQYYEDMVGFWRYLYDPNSTDNTTYFIDTNDNNIRYWNRLVVNDPASLLFWFDFIDGKNSALSKYSVKAIGHRTKMINDNDIKAIYYGEIPNIVYITQEDYNKLVESHSLNDGYVYILLPESMQLYFKNSAKSKSAQDVLDQLVYEHAYCNESVSITTIPIYHLEPNTRISIYDERTKINGEYIINKISTPLNYNGTMSISATKAPIRLF